MTDLSPIAAKLLTTTEATAYTGFSKSTLEAEVAAGRLAKTKMRSRTFYNRDELDRWLRELPERRTA